MSKSEILSWTSLASSASIAIFYFLIVFGWPEAFPNMADNLQSIAFKLFWVAFAIEFLVDLDSSLKKKKVAKDERDYMIEGKGYKVGYNILVFAVVFSIIQYFLSGLIGPESDSFAYVSLFETSNFFHFLFISLFVANVGKRGTMIYQYRKFA